MKRALIATMVVMLCVAAASGCSKRSKSPSMARVDEEAIRAARMPVNVLDYDLRNKVACDIAGLQRLEDDRLAVRVNMRNSTREALHVEARAVFKSAEGLSTGDETAWQSVFFSPQQIQTYTMVSRDPGAQLATVEVRRP